MTGTNSLRHKRQTAINQMPIGPLSLVFRPQAKGLRTFSMEGMRGRRLEPNQTKGLNLQSGGLASSFSL